MPTRPNDARVALKFGAEGIGLCRTEHMFFDEDRIRAVREMILADDEKAAPRRARQAPADAARRISSSCSRSCSGLPVTIRLLDPPLHEFLPHSDEEIAEVAAGHGRRPARSSPTARASCTSSIRCSASAAAGWRSPIPEIAEMQARAIFEAAVEAGKRTGKPVVPEVMVPLIATKAELDLVKARIDAMARGRREGDRRQGRLSGRHHDRAAARLRSWRARSREAAEFFSFGTNDLTQTTFGISRDDAASFLGPYTARGILAADPFVSIDREGVGELMRIGVERGRKARPKLKLGICGEHGGDPASVAFCHELGLDYVSCSPFRVPIARLAAAQAALGKDAANQA